MTARRPAARHIPDIQASADKRRLAIERVGIKASAIRSRSR